MAYTHSLLASSVLSSGSATSINFNNIPQNYTDLRLVLSTRDTYSGPALEVFLRFNGVESNIYTYRRLQGSASSATTQTGSDTKLFIGGHPGATATSNTFSNIQIYVPNYAGSGQKSVSIDSTFLENGSGYAYAYFNNGISTMTSPVNSITLLPQTAFAQYTSAHLYGIRVEL